MALDKQPSNQL